MRVITFSRYFPKSHPRSGEPTFFVEQILNSVMPKQVNGIVDRNILKREVLDIINDFVLLDGKQKKGHTIRAGNRWKVGDTFSPRVWSGKPYRSKQIEFASPITIKKIWSFESYGLTTLINDMPINHLTYSELAKNDGLNSTELHDWIFCHPKAVRTGFKGQIICWDKNIEY